MRMRVFGAVAGLLFTVGTIAGNEMANAGDASGDNAATALANIRRAHGAVNHAGMALEIIGFISLMFFAGYLYRVLRAGERPDGWLAAVVLVAAAADLGIKLGSGAPLVAAYAHPADLSPDLARTLTDLNTGGFLVTGLTMAAFVLAVSCGAYASRVLPRTIVWIGIALGLLGMVTPILGLTDPANYNPLPYLVSLLWIVAVAIARLIIESRRRGENG